MKNWTITFKNNREPLNIKGESFLQALRIYLNTNNDLSFADLSFADLSFVNLSNANLSNANLSFADLRKANLRNADLRNADLRNANLDFSCFSLWCGSLDIKIDKRIACQLLYHTLRAMQSLDDEEAKTILNDDKVLAFANQFHRVEECGKIVKEQTNVKKES